MDYYISKLASKYSEAVLKYHELNEYVKWMIAKNESVHPDVEKSLNEAKIYKKRVHDQLNTACCEYAKTN